jgi:hypothetical protein
MAINDKDVENAKPLAKRLKEKWRNADLGIILAEPFRPSDLNYRTVDQSFAGMAGLALMGISSVFYTGMQYDSNMVTKYPEAQTEIQFSADLGTDEYFAVTQDGQSGYAIFNNDGLYRLYEFNSESVDGYHSLQYIPDNSESWHTARSIASDFGNLLNAYNDPQAELEADAWKIVSLEGVTNFVVDDDDNITRYFTDVVDVEDTQGVGQTYETMSLLWHGTAQSLGDIDQGFSQAEKNGEASKLSSEQMYWAQETYEEDIFMGAIFLLGGVLSVGSAIGPIGRRRRKEPRYGGY